MNATPLAAAAIHALVADSASHVAIEVVDETGSTNADLLARVPGAAQMAPAALHGPVLRVAERQTAGRGRAGRSWLSAPGASLTFSSRGRSARRCTEWRACHWRLGWRWPKR